MIMTWTLFVLDFDETYDFEEEESYGVEPMVYLIPEYRALEVSEFASKAKEKFHDENNGMCIGDLFEEELETKGIEFQLVGSLHIPFEERQCDYIRNVVIKSV